MGNIYPVHASASGYFFGRIQMKKLSPLFLPVVLFLVLVGSFVVSGCEGEYPVNLRYEGGNYIAPSYDVFDGVLNGAAVHFRSGAGQYRCGTPSTPDDALVYYFDAFPDGSYQQTLNADLSQASCTNFIYPLISTSQSHLPVVSNG